jgi:hypothetical protein
VDGMENIEAGQYYVIKGLFTGGEIMLMFDALSEFSQIDESVIRVGENMIATLEPSDKVFNEDEEFEELDKEGSRQ